MKKLFLIDGAMRPVKFEIVKYLKEISRIYHGSASPANNLIIKFSDKEYDINEGESEETQDFLYDGVISSKVVEKPENYISYNYSGHTYAFSSEELEKSTLRHENTFVIIRSTPLIQRLKKEYDKKGITVIPIYVYSDKKVIEESYKNKIKKEKTKKYIDINERNDRLNRANADFENSLANPSIYSEIIIYTARNATGSSSIRNKLEAIIKKYENLRETNSVFLIHSYKDRPVAKNFYDKIVESAKELWGESKCVRSLLFGSGSYKISDTIFELIEKNDVLVVDITPCEQEKYASPNVWIELGYALAIMKSRSIGDGEKLIITYKMENASSDNRLHLPVDIQNYNVLFYNDLDKLKEEFINHFKNKYSE